MKHQTFASALALVAAGAMLAGAAEARDQIRVVGSSTVYPFTTAVAEQLGKTGGIKTPVPFSWGRIPAIRARRQLAEPGDAGGGAAFS